MQAAGSLSIRSPRGSNFVHVMLTVSRGSCLVLWPVALDAPGPNRSFGSILTGTHHDFEARGMKRWAVARTLSLTAVWWILVVSYAAAPCELFGELEYYTMALFACQPLQQLPVELPTLSLVLCLVVCLVLLPNSILHVSALRWNALLHSVGIATLVSSVIRAAFAIRFQPQTAFRESLAFMGIVTGRAAAIYLGMMLLVISRRSVFSEWHSLDYTNTIAFHRVVGWWVVAMSLLHSLAFGVFYLERGGWRELLEACLPLARACSNPEDSSCWNTLGLVNGFGVVATLFVTILALLSCERVRRAAYNLFYFTHLIASFVFMLFCSLHDFPMAILMFPGLSLYMKDRLMASRSRVSEPEVTAEILCRHGASSVVLLTWRSEPDSQLMPGTRWVYLNVKSISRLQWHPYSVMQLGDRTQVLLKSTGDWSDALCNFVASGQAVIPHVILPKPLPSIVQGAFRPRTHLCAVKALKALKLGIEGPYGQHICSTSEARPRSLLLIAGGVGIAPFIDFLSGLSMLENAMWQEETVAGGLLVDQKLGAASGGEALRAEAGSYRMRILLSCLLITVGAAGLAVASDFLAHILYIKARPGVRSLAEYAWLLRSVPLLLLVLVLFLVSLGLRWLPHFTKPRNELPDSRELADSPHSPLTSARQAAGRGSLEEGPGIGVQRAKPDLPQLVSQQAALGPTEATVRELNASGLDVVLDTLESGL